MSDYENFEQTSIEQESEQRESKQDIKMVTYKKREEKNNVTWGKILKILAFYFVGISCFVPYNAILSGLDCFIYYHKDYYPEFVYSNLYFFSNFFVQLFIILVSPKYNYYKLIQFSLLTAILVLVLNPLVLLYFSNYISFVLSCTLTIIQGSAVAVLLTCLYSFIIYLHPTYITAVMAGHGFGGIIMNISRLVTFIIYDISENETPKEDNILKSFFIFYYVAAIFVLINIFIWTQLKNHLDVRRALRRVHPTLVMFDDEVDYEERCLSLCSYKEEITSINTKNKMEDNEYKKIKEVLSVQTGINILVFIHGIITFSLYPGILIKNKLFTANMSIRILIIFFIYNIFDIIGRQFPRFCHLKSFNYISVSVILRIYFFVLFPLISYLKVHNPDSNSFLFDEYFIVANLALMAYSNGFLISNSFIYIQQHELKEELKSKSSPVLSVSLCTGIYVGSTLAYLINYLISL